MLFSNIQKYFNVCLNDAPYPGQIGFQDPASPGFTGISDLHDNVFFFLILILLGVVWVLGVILFIFNEKKNVLVLKYLTHGTIVELV